jgi:hypothetical protein
VLGEFILKNENDCEGAIDYWSTCHKFWSYMRDEWNRLLENHPTIKVEFVRPEGNLHIRLSERGAPLS